MSSPILIGHGKADFDARPPRETRQPPRRFANLSELANWLNSWSHPAAGKSNKGPFFTPFARRERGAAPLWNVAVFDFDTGSPPAAFEPLDRIVYESRSSTPESPRWRVLVSVSEPIPMPEMRRLVEHFGADSAAAKPTQIFWGRHPSHPARYLPGQPLDWRALLAAIPDCASAAREASPSLEATVELAGEQSTDLRAALAHLATLAEAGRYDLWSEIGLALLALGETGRDLFCEFSQQALNYKPGAPEEFWLRNALTEARADWRHVLTLASAHGWQNSEGAPSGVDSAAEYPTVKAADAPKRRLRFRTALQMLDSPSQVHWLIRDEIERGVLAVMSGPMSTFKSFIAIEWALRIAAAGEQVLILSAEGGGLDRRIAAWLRANPQDDERAVRERVHCLEQRCDMGAATIRDELVALGVRPALLVIDTYSKFRGAVNEDKASEVGPFVGKLDQLRRELGGTSILLITHTGLTDQTRARGSSALEYDTDAAYVVAKDGDIATVTRERFKDAPMMSPLAFRAREVDLGYVDEDGCPVCSLALDRIDAPTRSLRSVRERPPGRYEQAVRKVFDSCLAESIGEAELIESAAENIVLSGTEKRDRRRACVARAIESLERKGLLLRKDGRIFDLRKSLEVMS